MGRAVFSVLVAGLLFAGVACDSGQQGSGSGGDSGSGDEPGSGETFDEDNFGEVVSDPNAHVGAQVELTGQLLESPEKVGDETAFQMYADPENLDWNTVVRYQGSTQVVADDYVRVRGVVAGELEGENAFGASVTAPEVEADSVVVVDAAEALDPAQFTADMGDTVDGNGFSVTVETIEFGEETTRAYLTLGNDTQYSASFYAFGAKIIQGSRQIEPDPTLAFDFDLPEPQSDLSPGVESEGVIVYGPVDHNQPFDMRFEFQSENYMLPPTQLTLKVTP